AGGFPSARRSPPAYRSPARRSPGFPTWSATRGCCSTPRTSIRSPTASCGCGATGRSASGSPIAAEDARRSSASTGRPGCSALTTGGSPGLRWRRKTVSCSPARPRPEGPMAVRDLAKKLTSTLARDEFAELGRRAEGLQSASAETAAYLELEVRGLAERVARLEAGVESL